MLGGSPSGRRARAPRRWLVTRHRPHGQTRKGEIEMKPTNGRALWIATMIVAVALAGGAYAAAQSSTRSSDQPSAKSAGKRTIHLTEASATPDLATIDTGVPGLSPGDVVVTKDGLLDPQGGDAGTTSQVCTLVSPAATLFTSTFECTGSFVLAGGTISVEGPFVPTADVSVEAVTGGTGEFVKARGQVTIAAEADTIEIELA